MAGRRVCQPPVRSLARSLVRSSLCLLALLSGCRSAATSTQSAEILLPSPAAAWERNFAPSNSRNWTPDLAVLPYAETRRDRVTVHNVRNCVYESDTDYVVQHYDRTFDLADLTTVDFLVVPFKLAPSLAHTMLSFGFRNHQYLGVSVEARLEQGETYSPWLGSLGQYELMYVIADERDLIVRRTRHRGADVYLYPTVATPEQSRELFIDVMRRVNKLYLQPEFYDTLTNNCTSNLVQHVNRLRPGKVPYDPRLLLTGLSDEVAFEVGLIRGQATFDQTKRDALITAVANRSAEQWDFSNCIRR